MKLRMPASATEGLEKIEGFLLPGEESFLYISAKNSKLPIVEIGSYKGRSTVILAKGSRDGNQVLIYAIDPHTGAKIERDLFGGGEPLWTYDVFMKNIKDFGFEDIVCPIVMTSQEASVGWGKTVGMVWVDGDHSYDMAKLDFKIWQNFLVEGGLIAFHDSTNPLFGVEKMIRENLFKAKQFSRFGLVDGIIYAYKIRDCFCKRFFYLARIKTLIFFIKLLRGMPIPSDLKNRIKVAIKKIL